MRNRIITREEAQELAREAIRDNIPQSHYHYMPGDRCPVMPSIAHCWHDTGAYWDGILPPPLVCCWCGVESDEDAVPMRHGPHAKAVAV